MVTVQVPYLLFDISRPDHIRAAAIALVSSMALGLAAKSLAERPVMTLGSAMLKKLRNS
ncbi:MAG: hypothetical protein SVT56_12305 [Chloroflexota bacterium]|nr:hypothetical protein [Chloroflexota bacterium]